MAEIFQIITYLLVLSIVNAFILPSGLKNIKLERSFTIQTSLSPDDKVYPSSFANMASQRASQSVKAFTALTLALHLWYPVQVSAADSSALTDEKNALEGIYSDKVNQFVIIVPPSWSINSRKLPVPKITRYSLEEVLFTATSFGEGSSLGITKSNARSLLQDFDVEYWFAPLNLLEDLGTADLVAKLLILQRQGEFEKKITTSELVNASFNDKKLDFTFDTPIAEGIYRRTAARTFFRNGSLYTVWISALSNIFEGDYGKTLDIIRNSFLLI